MARLIDAEKLKEGLEWHFQPTDQECDYDRQWAIGYNAGLNRALYSIAYAKTIDPVIRCRDCAVPHNKWTGCPKLNGLVPPDNFYCAFGVRRDSDGKSD